MKKRYCFLSILALMMITVVLLLSSCGNDERDRAYELNLSASDGEPAGGFLWEHNYSEITITGYVGSSNTIIIPETINGKIVTRIAADAFKDFAGMTELTVSRNVKEIGDNAFSGCKNLSTVNWNSVEEFAADEDEEPYFPDSENIETVAFGSDVRFIPDNLFKGCSKLSKVTGYENVEKIGHDAFSCCYELTVFPFGDKIKEIKYSAFFSCTAINTELHIPESLNSLEPTSFLGCSGIDSITVDEKNQIFKAKGNCLINIEDNMLLQGCNNSVIPEDEGITTIGAAFMGCKELKSVKIPDGVRAIGVCAFEFCENLEKVEFPDSLIYIDQEAFSGCTKLKSVDLSSTRITEVETATFSDCTSLSQVKLPEKITVIGDGAFSNTALTTFTGSTSLEKVGTGAFKNCKQLTTVNFSKVPETFTILNYAFDGCTSLATAFIPDLFNGIGFYAFRNTALKYGFSTEFGWSAVNESMEVVKELSYKEMQKSGLEYIRINCNCMWLPTVLLTIGPLK